MVSLTVVEDIVWIDVTFSEPTYRSPKDHALYVEFLEWQLDTNIFPVGRGHSGPLGFSGVYLMEDAVELLAWLKDHNIKEG